MSSKSKNSSYSSLILGQKGKFKVEFKNRSEWVPDKDAKSCTNCKNSFGLFVGRHHCRVCGKIFDSKCSSNYLHPPQYTYNNEKKIRLCDGCFLTVKSKENEHAYYNHSLAKYTDAVEKGLTKILNETPFIPVVIKEENQKREESKLNQSIRENGRSLEQIHGQYRSQSLVDIRPDQRKISVVSEQSFFKGDGRKIVLIFDKELDFAKDAIVSTIEGDLKIETISFSLFDANELQFKNEYRLVLIFINLWRHIPEESEKICQSIYQTCESKLKMIYLTNEINKQVYKKAELSLKSENILKLSYSKDKKINPKTHKIEFLNFLTKHLSDN